MYMYKYVYTYSLASLANDKILAATYGNLNNNQVVTGEKRSVCCIKILLVIIFEVD